MSLVRRATCAGWMVLLAASLASAQPPSLTHTVPAAVLPGQTTEVTFVGANLIDGVGVWTSFASQAERDATDPENGKQPGQIKYRLTVPADVPVGIAGIRVATNGGVSNLRLVMVDDLPSVAENGQNATIETAQAIAAPIAVDGKIDPESSDYYRFHAAAGARITVEAIARRLGFALDPVVRLLDADGNELVYADDDPSLGPDCRFAFVASADADYVLEIRDVRFQGGDAFRYRLRVGNFPLVSTTFPLAARRGQENQLEAAGTSVEGMGPMTFALAADCSSTAVPMGVTLPGGAGSASVTVASSDLEEHIESEPNEATDALAPVTLPRAFNGRLGSTRDRDVYSFTATAGSRYLFQVQSRSLGSPADLLVRILNADGSRLAEAENPGGGDREIDFQVPADGTYRLQVEELYARSGPELTYRIEARPYEPGFTLTAEVEKLDVPRGGVLVTKVTAQRRDFNGPITLSLDGLGESFTLAGNVIPEGQNETTLQATIADNVETGRFAPIRILGEATIGDRQVQSTARTKGVLTAAFSGLAYPPAAIDGLLALGVGPVFPDFFKLALDRETVRFPRLVGASTFTVKTERLNGFEEGVALRLEGLPPGVTADVKPIEKGQGEVVVTLAGPALLSDAAYQLQLIGDATFQNQPKRVTLANVPLQVVDPLAITGTLAAPLAPGATAALKLNVTRFGDASPVRISFTNLPAGVTAPAEVTIAPDQQEIEVPLTAAADAPTGKYEAATVIGQSDIKGQAVVTQSPLTIDIAAP
jgi:hypothetical protein